MRLSTQPFNYVSNKISNLCLGNVFSIHSNISLLLKSVRQFLDSTQNACSSNTFFSALFLTKFKECKNLTWSMGTQVEWKGCSSVTSAWCGASDRSEVRRVPTWGRVGEAAQCWKSEPVWDKEVIPTEGKPSWSLESEQETVYMSGGSTAQRIWASVKWGGIWRGRCKFGYIHGNWPNCVSIWRITGARFLIFGVVSNMEGEKELELDLFIGLGLKIIVWTQARNI